MSEEDTYWWRKARVLKPGLERDGFEVRLVNRLSCNLEDLKLCIEHRATHLPRWKAVYKNHVWVDQRTIPSLSEVRKMLKVKTCRMD